MLKVVVALGVTAGILFANSSSYEGKLIKQKERLGKQLYQDKSFSLNRAMSCATCHDIKEGLVDIRVTNKALGASLGDDGFSIGDRNAPTVGYSSFSPEFHFDDDEGLFIGGQFLDGRAKNLHEQAKGPFLNPIEMRMPDVASVIERLKENKRYVRTMKRIYGYDIFDNDMDIFNAMADSIVAFEKSRKINPFNSKYDRYLAGKKRLSAQEQRGLEIFSNEDEIAGAGRCTLCHPIEGQRALMTDFSYDNLGVPTNNALRSKNGQAGIKDVGLYANPKVYDEGLKGAFKVSSLRNIAVTGPYMHNGVFKDLKTVIHFYNTRDVAGAINPETGLEWEEGEFHDGRNTDELGDLGLSDQDEDDLVSFLKTFTDRKFRSLMK